MDQVLKSSSCPQHEFMRYMHIGLLCVQEDAYIRPTMSFIALMLKSDECTISLARPARPPFSYGRFTDKHDELGTVDECSTNGLTISVLDPR